MMDQRFGFEGQSTYFQALLYGKTWEWGEDLRSYQDEIRHLVSLAFPEIHGRNYQYILVKKYFIDEIQDSQLKERLLIDPLDTLHGIVHYCERYVAAKAAISISLPEKNDKIQKALPETGDLSDKQMIQILQKKGYIIHRPYKLPRSKDMSKFRCYKCNRTGHMAYECQDSSQK